MAQHHRVLHPHKALVNLPARRIYRSSAKPDIQGDASRMRYVKRRSLTDERLRCLEGIVQAGLRRLLRRPESADGQPSCRHISRHSDCSGPDAIHLLCRAQSEPPLLWRWHPHKYRTRWGLTEPEIARFRYRVSPGQGGASSSPSSGVSITSVNPRNRRSRSAPDRNRALSAPQVRGRGGPDQSWSRRGCDCPSIGRL